MNHISFSTMSMPNIKKRKSIIISFWIFSTIFIISLSGLYLFQTNEMSKKHSLIKYYENEIRYTSSQNKNLEITFSQNNSLRNLENTLEDSNFEKVTKIDYIRILDTSVAAK